MPRKIDDLFIVHRAKSGLFSEYEPGPIAYIGNGRDNNGVVGFVEPQDDDTVFRFAAIAINAFSRTPDSCGARVQMPPFIATGRSGNGVLVLEPRRPMSIGQLAFVAAYINKVHGWRFTWYRQTTKTRITGLALPERIRSLDFPVASLLPEKNSIQAAALPQLRTVQLGELFVLKSGDYHVESELPEGKVPLVSCGDEDNGVVAYVDPPQEHVYHHQLTIALNGSPLTTKYHPYDFVAKDDVAVAVPQKGLRLTTTVFIQMMLNRERWRYSYYRKCFVDKLRRFSISLPADADGSLDEDGMSSIIAGTAYWSYLSKRLQAS